MYETISKKGRATLNSLAIALNRTSDLREYKEYETVTEETARGYLEGVAAHASAQSVLLAYFVLRLLTSNGSDRAGSAGAS